MKYAQSLVATFQEIILLVFQYKCEKSCAEDQILKDLILRTRLCSTSFIAQYGWVVHFIMTGMVTRKWFVPGRYQLTKRKSAGLALKYIGMIHRIGRVGLFREYIALQRYRSLSQISKNSAVIALFRAVSQKKNIALFLWYLPYSMQIYRPLSQVSRNVLYRVLFGYTKQCCIFSKEAYVSAKELSMDSSFADI